MRKKACQQGRIGEEDRRFMAEQATVDPSDIEDLVMLLKETQGPLPVDALLERYVARLKERVTAQNEAADKPA
jgi:hypothetical protein